MGAEVRRGVDPAHLFLLGVLMGSVISNRDRYAFGGEGTSRRVQVPFSLLHWKLIYDTQAVY